MHWLKVTCSCVLAFIGLCGTVASSLEHLAFYTASTIWAFEQETGKLLGKRDYTGKSTRSTGAGKTKNGMA